MNTLEAIPKRRVLLVDDHPLVLEWLTNLINQEEDLVVCGEAASAPQALQSIETQLPEAAVVDLSLASGSGIELIKDLKACCPQVAVVVLSMHDESLYAERALRAGARGYVTKRETTKKIIAALRQVLSGQLFFSDQFASTMTERHFVGRPPSTGSIGDELSDRELQVFEMLGQGFETRRIAESLNLSMKTVQTYCARIKEKLNINTVNELMREAVRWAERRERMGS